MEQSESKKIDLVYPDLSYQIIGVLYEVFNQLGYGYKEVYYQRAAAKGFKQAELFFKEQVPAKIKFKDEVVGLIYLDFLINNKIVLELKKSDKFYRKEIEQVSGYLKATNLKLGILVHFTRAGVKFKRILNIN